MKSKKILVVACLAFFLVISTNAYAQNLRIDFDSTEMSIISNVIRKSQNINLPSAVVTSLKVYAKQQKLAEYIVFKNALMLKMLYNPELTFTEKKVFLRWAVDNYKYENKYLPVRYFEDALANLKP
jgi:hypothetical protein